MVQDVNKAVRHLALTGDDVTNDRPTALRVDIQALRAVAVLTVVLFHLWPNRLTGGYVGVDVFFVISGFLITSHIVRDAEANRFSVTAFWARRMLRLLPASLLVLAVTAVGVWMLAPAQYWEQWFREIAAAGLYAQNWLLAGDAVDYLAADNVPSPVQHYWSLSAEEQFYIVWPLLIGLSLLIGPRNRTELPAGMRHGKRGGSGRRASWRPVAIALLALVVVASLVTSVVWTDADQAYAYFITPTRAWEFGAGALLAFVPALGRRRAQGGTTPATSGLAAGVVAWVGLALIIVSAVTFTEATPFPGAWAAIPVLGTVLVIWAAATDRFTERLAGLSPIQFVGDVSYAIYLWHWPLIVLVPFATGHDLRTLDKLAILVVTVLLAWGTRRWIEKPVLRQRQRFAPRPTFIAAAVAGTLVVCAGLVGVQAARMQAEAALAAVDDVKVADCFGAAARPPDGRPCDNPDLVGVAVPAPEAADDDEPEPWLEGENQCPWTIRKSPDPALCERGDRTSDVRIAMVGDSHAAHYASGLVGAAEANGWALDLYMKEGCPFSDVMRVQDEVITPACISWVDKAEQLLDEGDYDLVVTSQISGKEWVPPADAAPDASQETIAEDGLVSLWGRLADKGLPVAAIADTPRPDPKVIDCLSEPDADLATGCRVPRDEATSPFDPQRGAAARLDRPDVKLIDFTDIYCDDTECLPVIGGATVYRDDDHLTDTFAATLAPYLADAIRPMLGEEAQAQG